MKKILGILGVCMVMGLSTVSMSACEETDLGETAVPRIFEQVDALLPEIQTTETLNGLKKALSDYKLKYGTALKMACEEYHTSLSNVGGKPSNLASTQLNSGYYQAVYILLYRQYDRIYQKMDDAGASEFKAFFDSIEGDGCNGLIDHAIAEGKVR